jgi:hypothetical protein
VAPPREFVLKGKGKSINVDTWVCKFQDKHVETADVLRGASICLFKRIYGEFSNPEDAVQLDVPGALPSGYSHGKEVSEFEQQIWDNFWNIANDPKKAEELGIKANHGEVIYTESTPGKTWRVDLRASDGLSIKPLKDDEPDPFAKPAA